MTYVRIYSFRGRTAECNCLDDLVGWLAGDAEHLQAMAGDGVVLDGGCYPADDAVLLVTDDPEIAAKYDMEAWDEGEM